MGDRVSISFQRGGRSSVVLFSHWGGKNFVESAQNYVDELVADIRQGTVPKTYPLGRLEPATVMVDFIRYMTADDERIMSNLYLGATDDDGDNGDNGHFDIDLDKAMNTQKEAAQ